ncbi:MAG: organomercurial lyase [Actinomycetes bacterium]
MTPEDLRLRNATYRLFVGLGRAPTAEEVADDTDTVPVEVVRAWRRLHEQHALVLDESRAAVLMANPFSAVPTRYQVEAAGRSWWANCAWDAFGVCDVLGGDGRIETVCLDCDEPLVVEVRGGEPDDPAQVFHCLVPARHWWDDIVFT